MQKVKFNFTKITSIFKCVLIGIISTLIGIIIFSITLKFADLSSTIISYVNGLIKIISIFIMISCLKRKNGDKLLLNSILAGVWYALISFIIFSILSGSFVLNIGVVYDLLFAVISSAIVAVLVNILKK